MDCHQQNQYCKNLPCFNLLTYETDTNCEFQQHQNSLWTSVQMSPCRGICIRLQWNAQKHTSHTDVVQFVQMRKALLSSIKQNEGSTGPTAPTLDAQRETGDEGEEVNKIYHEHSQWSVKKVSHSSQKNLLLLVKWFGRMQSLISGPRNMIWID